MKNIKYVVDNSKYVRINYDKLDDFIQNLATPNYMHWAKELNLELTEKEWILLCTLIESMNFCFWRKPKWKIEYHNDIHSGSNALFYSVIKYIENNKNFLDLEYLYKIDLEKFKEIFIGVEGEIPHIEKRYNNFKEVIEYIYNNQDKFYTELFNIKTDKELLNYIAKTFTSFNDVSTYKEVTINFYKRATLLTNDLYHVSNTIKNNIVNVDNLTGCADYAIPRIFRDYYILEYNKELSEMVDNEQEIPHNSEMEIEIRANMLYVIELIKKKLLEQNIVINSVELDNVIWNMGKRIDRKSNSHHTVTIYY